MVTKTDLAEIEQILADARVVFLSFHRQPAPYVIPLFFGYERGRLYVHSARTGTKIRLLEADPRVGFSAATSAEIVEGKSACSSTARAASVVGTGTARIVTEERERLHALDLVMRHSTGRQPPFHYKAASLARTLVIAVDINAILGKGTENRPGTPLSPDAGHQER